MLDRSKYWEKWPYDTKEEGQAEDILRTCAKERGFRNMPIPVPIEELIEGPLHMNFEVCDLSGLGPDVIGSAWCEQPPTIAVSEKIENENGRFRFTCAHELGHIVLHRHLALRFDDAEQGMLVQDNGMEAEANRFASRILMPWQAVESEMMRVFRDFDMDPRNYLPMLLCTGERSVWLWKYRILPRITQRFEVSLSAAIYRFNSISLPLGRRFLSRAIIPRLLSNEVSIGGTLKDVLRVAVN